LTFFALVRPDAAALARASARDRRQGLHAADAPLRKCSAATRRRRKRHSAGPAPRCLGIDALDNERCAIAGYAAQARLRARGDRALVRMRLTDAEERRRREPEATRRGAARLRRMQVPGADARQRWVACATAAQVLRAWSVSRRAERARRHRAATTRSRAVQTSERVIPDTAGDQGLGFHFDAPGASPRRDPAGRARRFERRRCGRSMRARHRQRSDRDSPQAARVTAQTCRGSG